MPVQELISHREVSQRWPGIETEKVFLVGYSGGGQFAQRFFYLYPERLHAVSIGAPGRVTRLDTSINWPRGTKNVDEKFNRKLVFENLKDVKNIQLVVGAEDNAAHGGDEFSKWLEKVKKKRGRQSSGSEDDQLSPMKSGRLQMATDMLEEWKGIGVEARFDVVPGVAHSSQGVRDVVLNFLEPLILQRSGEKL
jgi:hypothetical protein